jgi:uncharacterized repeat protein (TIGR03803 family)
MPNVRLLTTLAVSALTLAAAPARAQVLHLFTGSPSDGAAPKGGLVDGANGVFYGTTFAGGASSIYAGGTVYRLTPPAPGASGFTEQPIYNFPASTNDGQHPQGDLVLGPDGSLYGATHDGQNASVYGTIFKLTPPVSGAGLWTESILYTFNGTTGSGPVGSLIMDASGALYGLAYNGGTTNDGTAFKLSPPAAGQTQWTLQTLHNFGEIANDGHYPVGKLAMDASGALYGATNSGNGTAFYGTVFKLTPAVAGEWAETVVYNFPTGAQGGFPTAGVTLAASGALYGTASIGGPGSCDCGVVYELAPANGAWTYSPLHSFSGPDGNTPLAGLVQDSAGNLYGTTSDGGTDTKLCTFGCGVVFKLAPPAGGSGSWTETYYAPSSSLPGANPQADLLLNGGFVYGAALNGGLKDSLGNGTLFRLPQ